MGDRADKPRIHWWPNAEPRHRANRWYGAQPERCDGWYAEAVFTGEGGWRWSIYADTADGPVAKGVATDPISARHAIEATLRTLPPRGHPAPDRDELMVGTTLTRGEKPGYVPQATLRNVV